MAALGAAATDLGPWYQSLSEAVLAAAGLAVRPGLDSDLRSVRPVGRALAWSAAPIAASAPGSWRLFALNALLNVLWSELFFGLHRPDWALVEVVPFWLSIVLLIVALAPISRRASLLLLPYLAWVTFAAVLNLAVVRLNPPPG